jgi:D-alanyl-D-alanine dipeptidase
MKWSKDSNDQVAKEKYYPDINKADVFKLGYVAEKSGHSRGSTVDLSIIRIGDSLKPITFQKRQLKNGSIIPFLDDGSVDMSSSFDLFGEASHHDSNLIETEFLARRNYLRGIMKKNGLNDYPEEWWHYTLKNEPFPDTYFDFVVE